MNNLTLGRTLKAMYKLSGKTLSQLSEETGLTVDTINNLFYARIQKPGLAGVNALVGAMGFSIGQLMAFLDENPALPEDCDVTELFTKYSAAAEDTGAAVRPAKSTVKVAKGERSSEIELLNAEHEKQLDRFRATHQRYSDQLREQQDSHVRQLQAHFNDSTAALKEAHAREIERMEKENVRLRRTEKILGIAIGVETGIVLLLLVIDVLNRSIGWLR